MNHQEKIKCPNCGHMIELSEAISHDIEDRLKVEYDQKFEQLKKDSEITLKRRQEEYEQRLKAEREQLVAKAKKDAMESVTFEMSDLKDQLIEKNSKLQEAQRQELELRKRTRELVSNCIN